MSLQEENEALREACTKALESAKRNRLNLKEVLAENEQLRNQVANLRQQNATLQAANQALRSQPSGGGGLDAMDYFMISDGLKALRK